MPAILNNLHFWFVQTATGQYCSGDLIFEDTFDSFDLKKWQHENTLSGGGVSSLLLHSEKIIQKINHFHLLQRNGNSNGTQIIVQIHSAKKVRHIVYDISKIYYYLMIISVDVFVFSSGYLHIRPTLTSDVYGETFLSSGTLNIHGGSSADQ